MQEPHCQLTPWCRLVMAAISGGALEEAETLILSTDPWERTDLAAADKDYVFHQ